MATTSRPRSPKSATIRRSREPVFLDASRTDLGPDHRRHLPDVGNRWLGRTAISDKKYILYDASVPCEEGGYDNVYSIQYKQNEGSYLGGMLAASLLKEGKLGDTGKNLGFLGGMDIPVINDFLVGYIAGAQSVMPDAKIAISYAGSFMDAAKGKELGLGAISLRRVARLRRLQTGPASFRPPRKPVNMFLGVDPDQEAIQGQRSGYRQVACCQLRSEE